MPVVFRWTIYCVLAIGCLYPTSYAEHPVISIGVVDVPLLMQNAPEAARASEQLKQRFKPQELKLARELEAISLLEAEFEAAKNSLTEQQTRQQDREIRSRKRERTRNLEDFREELRFARDKALDEVQKNVFIAIEEVRAAKNIDIVLREYVAASKRVNITATVLELLEKKLSASKDKQPEGSN